MDSCGIFFLVVALGLLIGIPIALHANSQHQDRLKGLREVYSDAKLTSDPSKIISAARAIVEEVKRSNPMGLAGVATDIYRDMLSMLKTRSELKPFALEMGRLAYGSKRKDGNLTIYDEQAILNDISAHL